MTPAEVSQQDSELIYNAINKLRDLGEKWNDRLTVDNLRLGERYANNEIHLLFYLRVGIDSEQFVACFQRADYFYGLEGRHGNWFSSLPLRPVHQEPVILKGDADAGHEVCAGSGKQQAVLVDSVKIMDSPEAVIPSLVWFDRADCIQDISVRPLYFSLQRGFQLGVAGADGEGNGIFGFPSVILPGAVKLERQMIESASQIVDDISRNHCNAGGDVGRLRQVEHFLASLRIVLGGDTMRIGAIEGCDNAVQIRDVLFGPFAFCSDTGKFVG
jgi:hypothetical protein